MGKISTACEHQGTVRVDKEFVDRKPRTSYELTDEGRELFEEHVRTLEGLIDRLDGAEE